MSEMMQHGRHNKFSISGEHSPNVPGPPEPRAVLDKSTMQNNKNPLIAYIAETGTTCVRPGLIYTFMIMIANFNISQFGREKYTLVCINIQLYIHDIASHNKCSLDVTNHENVLYCDNYLHSTDSSY